MKNIFKILFLAGIVLLASPCMNAQSMSDMRINEVLSINTDNFQDDYGKHHGWIELFNSSYGTVDIAGCYLSDDPGNLKKYMVPKGDVLTQIKPRQHILFWADNEPFRGTFHINFKLDSTGGTVYFTSSDGRTLIDKITYPALAENASYGRTSDGDGSIDGNGTGWQLMERVTPSTNNKTLDSSKALLIKEQDPIGIIMAITAMSVVFAALILLYLVFKQVGKSAIRSNARKTAAATKNTTVAVATTEASGEVYAAIALAIELYRMQDETHDIEHTVLTMDKVARTYSPWSSKIYGLREVPTKRKN